jgi:hypothetical protein
MSLPEHVYSQASPASTLMPKRARMVISCNLMPPPALILNEPSVPSAPHGTDAAGVVLDTVSSDNLKTVMGILDKFVQIGDQIAEVSLSLPSLDLLS